MNTLATVDARQHGVANLYANLWPAIEAIDSPGIQDQFLSNVGVSAGWFKGKKCLDAGCGSGFAVSVMQSLGGEVWGCDLMQQTLDRVHIQLDAQKKTVTLLVASVLDLPFESESFDFVHCNGVLHHTLDPRKGLAELVRVTKPGGTIFVSLYGKGGLYNYLVNFARWVAPIIPYRVADACLKVAFGRRSIPNSFMPVRVSVLDNMYVPIRHTYREGAVRKWFAEEGIQSHNVVRTQTTIYDHRKYLNRVVHGGGYLQFRATKVTNCQ